MNKLIPILFIIGILVISGCIQGGDTTQSGTQNTQSTDSGSTDTDFQKGIPVYFSSSELTPKEAGEKLKTEYGLPGEMKAGGFGIKWNNELDIPESVIGFRSLKYSGTPQDAANAFLQEYGDLIKLENNSLFFSDVHKSGDENDVIYEQRYKETPFYNGGEVRVLVTKDNRVRQLSVDYFPDVKVPEASEADTSAISDTLRKYLISIGTEGSELDHLMNYFEPERMIYPLNYTVTKTTEFRLTWLYRIPGGNRLFIDANTAEIVGDERVSIY